MAQGTQHFGDLEGDEDHVSSEGEASSGGGEGG